jgi:hypothetical protein
MSRRAHALALIPFALSTIAAAPAAAQAYPSKTIRIVTSPAGGAAQ